MNHKIFSPVISIVFALLLLPVMVQAADVPFYVYTEAEYASPNDPELDSDFDSNADSTLSPDLSMFADASVGSDDQSAETWGGSARMISAPVFGVFTDTYADNFITDPSTYSRSYAEVGRNMYFDSITVPVFRFSYDYSYSLYAEGRDAGSYATHGISATLTMWGNEGLIYDNTFLYDSVMASGENDDEQYYAASGEINVPVTVGSWYDVYLEVSETAYAEGDATAGVNAGPFILDYYVSGIGIMPEPISSSLFLVGAATLGFWRFRKRSQVKEQRSI